MAASHLLFLGTYTRSGGQGIIALRLDGATGAPGAPVLAAAATDPAWITLSPDRRFLYAIHPSAAQAIGYAVDTASGALTPLPAAAAADGNPPSHLAVDATGRTLLAANYRDGYVSAIPLQPDGGLGAPRSHRHAGRSVHPTRQQQSHVHSVTVSPDNRFVLVADLGLDRIFTYALDPAAAQLEPARPPFVATAPGAGPRHLAFGRDGRHVYAINELNNTITAYAYDTATGALQTRQVVPTLPPGFDRPNTTAEIRVHPNGRFLYGSNRGHDSLVVYRIDPATGALGEEPIGLVPTGGRTPRNFALSPDGRWLVCGHQDTPLLTIFEVDAATGRPTRTSHQVSVSSCVCVLFYT